MMNRWDSRSLTRLSSSAPIPMPRREAGRAIRLSSRLSRLNIPLQMYRTVRNTPSMIKTKHTLPRNSSRRWVTRSR